MSFIRTFWHKGPFKDINDHDKAKNENEFDTIVDGSSKLNPFEDEPC